MLLTPPAEIGKSPTFGDFRKFGTIFRRLRF